MMGHSLRHGDELHGLTVEGIRSGGRPRTKYISQIITGCRSHYIQEAQRHGECQEKTEKTFVVNRNSFFISHLGYCTVKQRVELNLGKNVHYKNVQ